jgi:hypothetical protein
MAFEDEYSALAILGFQSRISIGEWLTQNRHPCNSVVRLTQ